MFHFPFDVEKVAASLDLYDCGFAVRDFMNRPAQFLYILDRHTIQRNDHIPNGQPWTGVFIAGGCRDNVDTRL